MPPDHHGRRSFLRRAVAGRAFRRTGAPGSLQAVADASARLADRTPEDVARDEAYWREIQLAFALDRTILNLNNGGCSPSPRVVHDALRRSLDVSALAPAYYVPHVLEPQVESVRRQLAGAIACDPEEVAITRNASEALQIAQLGLALRPGDEILTTNQDYSRMLDTWAQRARRDGLRVVQIAFPVPVHDPGELVGRLARAITGRTRVLHFCHMTARTGQIFPVRELCGLARARGLQTIVDGAHGFAQLPVTIADLGCDYYATSLHKWLQAPVGTGFLYVRRERIRDLWPLQPAPEGMRDDIRKFEQFGTHPAAYHNAIAAALAFHRAIGVERKGARLRYLRDRWLTRLTQHRRVRALTSLEPAASCALGSISVAGIEPERLAAELWERRRIVVLPIWHREYRGIRVSASVYTTRGDIDLFADTMEQILREPLRNFRAPAAARPAAAASRRT